MLHLFMKLRKRFPKNSNLFMIRYLIYLFFFISCASQVKISTLPDWILKSKSDSNYWYGVGIAEKSISSNIREDARLKAVNEIASQISIKINSSLTNVITEYNYEVNEFSKSILESRVENNLQDIEFMNFHEDESRYYVQARLSKIKYHKKIDSRKKNAVSAALSYIEQSDNFLSVESFYLLESAMDEIILFLDQPINITYKNKEYNLYNLIKSKFEDKVNRIQLMPKQNQINTTFGFSDKKYIEIQTIDKDSRKALGGIPLLLSHSDSVQLSVGETDINGYTKLPIPQLKFYSNQKQFLLSIDFKKFKLKPSNYQKASITLEIEPPSIFVKIDEFSGVEDSYGSLINSVIKEYFASNVSAVFTKQNDADLVIKGKVNLEKTSDNPNEWGIYQTYANLSISVINNRTKKEIFTILIPNTQGADFNSNIGSIMDSISKISQKLETKYLPEVLKKMLEL